MSWEQRNADFCKAQTDAQLTYIEAERRAAELEDENAKLRELVADMRKAFVHGPCYRWCEHMPEPCDGDKCQYVSRMYELGVEL